MANYKGTYQSDNGKNYESVAFPVTWIDTTFGTRGNRTATTQAEDAEYIPAIFFQETTRLERNQATCNPPLTLRFALLWVSETRYLKVPIPFRPNSTQYNQFFIELSFNFSRNLRTVGLEGEFINPSWLERYVR